MLFKNKENEKYYLSLIIAIIILLLCIATNCTSGSGGSGNIEPEPTSTLTPTPTPTISPTLSPIPTPTSTESPIPTPTSTTELKKITIDGLDSNLNGKIVIFKEGITSFVTQAEVIDGVVKGDIYVASGNYQFVTSFTGVTKKYYPSPTTYTPINSSVTVNYNNFVDL